MQIVSRMVLVGSILLFLITGSIFANSDWVNKQGCYCGSYISTDIPITYISKGDGTDAEREASRQQMEYWNQYSTIYHAIMGRGLGAPGNGYNEVNTFISSTDAERIYGIKMQPNVYGMGIIQPFASFGNFNECKDFSSVGCGEFTETDILINGDFQTGWTLDPNDYTKAYLPTTALHEIGHTWGAHHVFTLPAFGDSFSSMNYMEDDSGKFVTRMDANTIRAAYAAESRRVTDVGIFPFIYGNKMYGETYASVSPLIIQTGQKLNISNFLLQNIGTESVTNLDITFYLSTDTTIDTTDESFGRANAATFAVGEELDMSFPLTIPQRIKNGRYYVGAIVTVNGQEDDITTNNKFIIGRPERTVITVGEGNVVDCVVSDPGFEKGVVNEDWIQTSTNFKNQVICGVGTCSKNEQLKPKSGNHWVWLGGYDKEDEIGAIEQTLTIPTGIDEPTLEFYLRIPQARMKGHMNVLIDGYNLFEVTDGEAGSYSEYRLVQIDVSEFADGGTHTLRFESFTEAMGAGKGVTSFFVDDLCIKSNTNPPNPPDPNDPKDNNLKKSSAGSGCFIGSIFQSVFNR